MEYPSVSSEPFFRVHDISLSADGTQILNGVRLDIDSGRISTLVGDRGSGKTTLASILSGRIKPTAGSMYIGGARYAALTPRRARLLRIGVVHERVRLLSHFSVAENMLMPDMISRKIPFAGKKHMIEDANKILARHAIDIDSARLLSDLIPSEQMLIYIIRSLIRRPRLLILDEALEKLAAPDFDKIVDLLNQYKTTGMAILCITHRIDDIYAFADKVSILKNGEVLLTDSVRNIDRVNLIKLCYTQFSRSDYARQGNQEFYQLLRYNEAILRKLPVNLVVVDNDHRVRLINEFAEQYFNLASVAYVNMHVRDLFRENLPESLAGIIRALSTVEEQELQHIPLVIENENRVVNIKTFPILDGAFSIGHIIILEDVTEKESLRRHAILSEKLASVGLLAAGVAHEINNPLAIIENYLVSLELEPSDKNVFTVVGNLREEISSIKQIVSNLISFSDSSRQGSECFDAGDLIDSLIVLIRHSTKRQNIRIHLSRPEEPALLTANKNEIKQVLLNLLKNSVEAMPSGGEIAIDLNADSPDPTAGREVSIAIRDTGRGIDDTEPNNVFLPFYSTKNGSGENLGLGLSVSYGIVKKYNGTITVRNREGGGCEFLIRFPGQSDECYDGAILDGIGTPQQ